jgi:hypothetical protein
MPRSHPIPDEQPVTFRDYSVFGLRVRSEIPLPELFEAGPGDADVTVRLGPTGVRGEFDGGLHEVAGSLLFVEPQIGRYRIAGGREIIVEARPSVPERNVRLFLLGSAFGALLHQRGLLPLHANALEIAGKAVAFMGPSGEGKSTLAAAFHDRGHRILADDVCVVDLEEAAHPTVRPGLPRLRLWRDSIEQSGRDAAEYDRSYAGDETLEKYDVPLARSAAVTTPVELAVVYLLARDAEFEITPLTGASAAEAVFANTYRGAFVSTARQEHSHWSACVRLVQSVPVYRVARPRALEALGAQCATILEHAAAEMAGP